MMDDLLSARQHQILIDLVREFISTAEPVGSSTLTHKYDISASPATIRNDMARLEEQGYLQQPHTSAGRVPTDKAYRYYVNFLMQKQIKVPDEARDVIDEYERYEAHVQNLLEYTSKCLADITNFTSLILAPRLRRTMFKYLKVAPLEDSQMLIILMTNTGAIINKIIHLEKSIGFDKLERITNVLNNRLSGMFLGDIHLEFLRGLEVNLPPELLQHICELTRETLQSDENRFIYDGASNLLNLPEFQNLEKLRLIMLLLEEEKMVADILKQTLMNEGVKIYIGQEHRLSPIEDCSFITAAYQVGQIPLGTIGIMGPKRMPYQKLIPVVNAFADVFSRKLTRLSNP
jgi:heat-inducible transcriptional repressor